MKFLSMTLAGSVAIFASAIYAYPAIFKRLLPEPDVVACYATMITQRSISTECAAKLQKDSGTVLGTKMPKFSFDLSTSTPQIASGNVEVSLFTFVPGIPLPITKASLNFDILDAGFKACHFNAKEFDVTTEGSTLKFDIPTTPCTVGEGEQTAFIKAVSDLITKESHAIRMEGQTSVILTFTIPGLGFASSSIPKLEVPAVGVSADITLSGINNFGGVIKVQAGSIGQVINDSAKGTSSITFKATLQNPSTNSVVLGAVTGQVSDSTGMPFGTITFKNLKIAAGENLLDVTLTANGPNALDKFSQSGSAGLTLAVKFSADSSTNTLVAGVAANLAFNLSF
ncbi:hypothetical protein BGW38_004897 [Lunasporangiospora selenospora]|uniref:Uncharacterized protein n=1 Tax=Lunasporangiospora selenospora TaxID=979761 RepID=A0A9P6KBU4_9FUNG|nr:hypothetical protein BGW38_004897 [Lunasporangiospora selenospora]